MKKALGFVALASMAVLLMAAARGAAGTSVFKLRADQTTANTKIAEFDNGVGDVVASIDREGDLIVRNITAGAITADSAVYVGSDFSTDVTVNTNKVVITAANGNTAIAGTLGVTGNVAVNTNKFQVTAASGNTSVAGTLAVTGATTLTGATTASTITASGAIAGLRTIVTASSGTTALTAAQSGALVYNTGTSGTTTFTLPTAAAGLHFCFAELGDAAGELLINPYAAAADVIVAKTHGAENGTGIATSANSGIKNTAATNVKGDHICLTAVDATTWVATSVAGVWAAQ